MDKRTIIGILVIIFFASITVVPYLSFVVVGDNHTETARTVQTIIQADDKTEDSYQQVENFVNSNQSQEFPDLREQAQQYLNQSEPQEPETDSSGSGVSVGQGELEQAETTDNGDKLVGSVTIQSRDFNFDRGVVSIEYNASQDVDATYIATEVNRRQQSASITAQGTKTFRADRNEVDVPIPVGSDSTTTINLITEEGVYASVVSAPPPIIQNLRGALLWTSGAGVAVAMIYYILRFWLNRKEMLKRYRPSSAYEMGNISNNLSETLEAEEEEEEPESIRGVLLRFLTVKKMLKFALLFVSLLYVLQTFTSVELGLPTPNDYVVSFTGFAIIAYVMISPLFVKPILTRLYSPNIEHSEILSSDGKTLARFTAEDGTFKRSYGDSIDGKVPVGRDEADNKVYKLSMMDREKKTAEPAFSWNLSEEGKEMLEDIEDEIPEVVDVVELEENEDDADQIRINEVLDDPVKAKTLIQDYAEMAKLGLHFRKNEPMIRQKMRMEGAKDIAMGLSKAVTGSPISDVLAEQSDEYRRKEKELEEELEKERRKAVEGEKAVQDEYDRLDAGDDNE